MVAPNERPIIGPSDEDIVLLASLVEYGFKPVFAIGVKNDAMGGTECRASIDPTADDRQLQILARLLEKFAKEIRAGNIKQEEMKL